MRRFISLLLLLAPLSCVDELDPPAFGVYQVLGVVAEVKGEAVVADEFFRTSTVAAGLVFARTAFSGPSSLPDFLSSPIVPNCLGTAFTNENPPGGNDIDAGNLTVSGLRPSAGFLTYELGAQPSTAVPLSSPITCAQIEDPFYTPAPGRPVETDIRHACDVPTLGTFDPRLTIFGPGTTVTFTGGGGTQAGSWASNPIEPPPRLSPAPGTSLVTDPREGITVQWTPVNAPFALIEIVASRADGVGAQILCLEPMTSGQKTIPEEALALVPEPQFTGMLPGNFVTVITSIAAVAPSTSPGASDFPYVNEGWGTYLVGLGNGSFGMNLLVAPPPQ